jgi:macrolide-specific efflux system membrane fusion protein
MKKAIKWIVILAIIGGGAGYWYHRSKAGSADASKPSYDKTVAEVRDIRIIVETTGEVQPRNRLDVKPPIAGRLEELMVDEGDRVKKGQILGWISSTERATLLDAALATSEEEYDYWAQLYKPSPLISPLDGTIIARNFEPGQSIGANDAVVVIADDLIIVANLDETDIGQIETDQEVKVALEAYPDREFSCVVEQIAYDAKIVSNVTMYDVDVRPNRLPGFARSGMTANLEFIVEQKEGVLTVPTAAIQQKSGARRGGGERPDFQNMSPEERRQAMTERMRERGMSEAEIEQRLARFAEGGGRSGGEGVRPGGARRGGGAAVESYVLVPSDDPENPMQAAVQVGVSDGTYTEITEGLEEGDEVLIQRISLDSRNTSGSSIMSALGGRRR